MAAEKPEEAMTFGELLELIRDQQRRLSVLETAFSYLAFSHDDKSAQLMIHSLKLESQNQNRDEETQKHFAQLAEEWEKRIAPVITPSAG
ncbi:hypothetical protein CYR32_01205 [Chimaeribacter coloradensis]|uniref:Uncharacterized protein n=1 Tax=Chimaeribacter coloradensis TaxID=2060068 RepID=A0A2N5ED00_9GAMM|nr:hypothetical protein [Chimaeribacter coloradensis]PLR40387.1 hypothetical protein CYR32_01205 [Chimaeribacter coloradensis]